jgi:UDP-glucose:(heptosyl)LPS alpha-1,3-glucosyltransferase
VKVPAGFGWWWVPVKALFNHKRNENSVGQADLDKRPVDQVVGFQQKIPGLDVYYAADGCYEDKAQTPSALQALGPL